MKECGENFTIYKGDCHDILPGIQGEIDALISDPPYGINFNVDYTRFSGGRSDRRNWPVPIANDDKNFDPAPFLGFPTVILWGANCYSNRLPMGAWLIWDKRVNQNANGFMSDGETGWCNIGHGTYIFNHTWQGFIKESERGPVLHPTQKPVALFEWCIKKYTKPGDTILDPFMGSGTTGIAALRTGRKFIGIELDSTYFDVALNRLQNASGQFVATKKERHEGKVMLPFANSQQGT